MPRLSVGKVGPGVILGSRPRRRWPKITSSSLRSTHDGGHEAEHLQRRCGRRCGRHDSPSLFVDEEGAEPDRRARGPCTQAEELQRDAVGGRDGLHPLARQLGDEEAAPADGDGGRPAVLSRPAAPPPEGAAEESVRGGEDLDAVVEHVRDIHLSAVLDQPVGRLEMAGSGGAARRGARVAAEAEPEGKRAGVEGGHRVALCDVEQCGVTLAERQRTRAHEAPLAGAEAA
mmetsp:Transcript_22205/g.70980  ORF Transcript_22205/g.70980 Transcript_22205/m.70980 type:complete len:230 (+) Transcript_22205:755-1444(+)